LAEIIQGQGFDSHSVNTEAMLVETESPLGAKLIGAAAVID
jgi:hypothetical protein